MRCIHQKQQGITLIEVLVALSIASFIFILIIDLFLQLLKTERRLSRFNQMTTTTNRIFEQINNDIRWADNNNNSILIENIPSSQTMRLTINDASGAPLSIYQLDAANKQIRMTRNGVDTDLLPNTLQVAELLFQDMRTSTEYRPLIYTRLTLKSTSKQDTILFERQTIASNLNTSINIAAALPLITTTPTPTLGSGTPTTQPSPTQLPTSTPTNTPAASATNTPTPTLTPTPPPGCELENNPGSWSSSTIGSGLPGKVNVTGTNMTICGDGKGLKATQTTDGLQAALKNTSANNLEITGKIAQWYPTGSGSQAGIFIRSSTNAGAAMVSFGLNNAQTLIISWRDDNNTQLKQLTQWSVSLNTWLKLIKSNDTITAYISSNSTDGINGNWQQVHTISEVSIGLNYTYGRYVTSGSTTKFASAVFSTFVVSENIISITPPPAPTPVPPTPTPTGPTSTPKPTSTPTNTPTPKATSTPRPTSTTTPTPTIYIPD